MASHDWQRAYDAFLHTSDSQSLSGEDLEQLAEAAWWTAHPKECIDALERAYAAYSHDGNLLRAAAVALHLAEQWSERLQSAQAAGWFQRATRLLDGQPESVEHGYLALAKAMMSSSVEDLMEQGAAMLDIGSRFNDNDLQAFGLMTQGMAHIATGQVERGMLLIDEATVAAVGGELSPRATGNVYCMTIVVCRDLADYKRAGEWTDATTRWCERQAISGFPGHCRVRRAEIIRLRGAFADAEVEARHAVQELISFGELPIAGVGFHEIGEIRLRMGDLDGAEEAFAEAHQCGNESQPGLALLQLARGRSVAARSSIRAALMDQPAPLARARLLPAQVEIALACHDVTEAREAAEELQEIASTFEASLWHANAHQALGLVLTYEGDASGAIAELRKALRHWSDADLPFETAQARRWLAMAHRENGDEASAVMELQAAYGTFERLGADLEAARALEAIDAGAPKAGRRITRTFMFTDIVGSTTLLETIGDDAWEGVVRWHDETLRSAIESQRGEVVHTTGDGFFATFEDAPAAAACAVTIQQRLAEHRRLHGFAPQVRIGLHAAEATVMVDDYAGMGVHQAARVGALAGADEILVTCETIEVEPIAYAVSDEREVSLKGITRPVRVVSIDWRT
jgi:class 3 adenylate cyclase